MNLADFTRPALLNPFLKAGDATASILELSEGLGREGLIPDPKTFYEAVQRREELSPTNTEHGWALPHARVAGLTRPWLALGRSAKSVRWTGGAEVKLVMLLAAPEPDTKGHYLKLISMWARLIRQTDLTTQLLQADDALQMFEALGGIQRQRATECAPYPGTQQTQITNSSSLQDRAARGLVGARSGPPSGFK